jgi:glycosyltransferase involved in cell wall biosynthesis
LASVEAQASGRPVVAFAAGGAVDTVIDGETGVLFSPQTTEALVDVLQRFNPGSFDGAVLRASAERFHVDRFVERMIGTLEEAYGALRSRLGVQAVTAAGADSGRT